MVAGLVSSAAAATPAVEAPCTRSERWDLKSGPAGTLPAAFRKDYELFLAGERTPLQLFAAATALKKAHRDDEAGAIADYWAGRAFQAAGLDGVATKIFAELVAGAPAKGRAPFQLAAMRCLERLHDANPLAEFPERALASLPAYHCGSVRPKDDMPTLWEATLHLALTQMRKRAPEKRLKETLSLLKGSGFYDDFANALVEAEAGRWEDALPRLVRLADVWHLPPALRQKRNVIRLLLATAYLETGKTPAAIEQLEKVDRQSNEAVAALSRLASAHLIAGDLSRAIGAAVNLQSGAMRDAFAPEAMMTAAIVLNEACQYPEALRFLQGFNREYEPAHRWLEPRAKAGRLAGESLYPLAVTLLKGTKPVVPARVAGEWIRSPVFIAGQKAINALFVEERTATERLREAEAAAATGALVDALPRWKSLITAYRGEIPARRQAIVARIDGALAAVNRRLSAQLAAVAANTELVQAEVYQSASQEIVGRIARSGEPAAKEAPPLPARTTAAYDWGAARSDLSGSDEIWEDEMGLIQANLKDRCGSEEHRAKPKPEPKT